MTTNFSQLTPTGFLQTFVLELMQLAEEATNHQTEEIIERIAHSASEFFEVAYREEFRLEEKLDPERYAEVILGLKNHIGGQFSLEGLSPEGIHVTSSHCPFGEGVKHSPELCRMTSSVFGGIAARNFGYAKVELRERIALGHSQCSVFVHLDPEQAHSHKGIEYREQQVARKYGEGSPIQSRIDERLHALWCQTRPCTMGPQDLNRPILIAESEAMQSVLNAIEVIAPTPATVLIEGETGVGKELGARAIHAMSDRVGQPFIAVNCGAIPEGIIESVLFGHEKGAFTGAIEVHHGYFERANGGTLFLDEVDALSPAAQVRLLRVLQEGEIERVGARNSLKVDVRIVAATNQGLLGAVEANHFRQDLFYRLNVVNLVIPRLAERREDIPPLVDLILKRLSIRYRKSVLEVSKELMQRLMTYDWPGNVRELENTLERAVLFSRDTELKDAQFALRSSARPADQDAHREHKKLIEQTERAYLEKTLSRHNGNVESIAIEMSVSRRSVYLKLKKYGLEPAKYRKQERI